MKKQIRRNETSKQVQKNQKGNNFRNALASGIVGFVLGLGLFGLGSMQQNNAAEAPVEVASVLGDTTERDLDTSAVAVDVIKEVEGAAQIVTRTNTVEVPGETKIVEVPGETKYVQVPGETKIVEVPGETKIVTKTEYVDVAVDHVYRLVNTKNNEDGTYDCTFKCDQCGDSYTINIGDKTEIPTHEHSYKEIERKEATCVSNGYVKLECECGNEKVEFIDALGHNYNTDEASYVAPTYESEGKEADQVCERCGDRIEGAAIDKLVEEHSHAYVETERVDATCCEDGYVVYTCNCGDSYKETLPATGHNFVKDEATYVAPTEDSEGKEADEVCSNCGEVKEGAAIEKLEKTHESHKGETMCSFNEYGYGFYNDIHTGEEVCTTRGAYRQYLADNYPECTICEDETSIWAE